MARLLDWPIGLRKMSYQRLSGPRAVGAASSESITGFVQTTSSAFGVWRYQISPEHMKGRLHRLYRSRVTGLHGGANAIRVLFCDPDGLSFADAGSSATKDQIRNGVPCSNDEPLSNGCNWETARPFVKVAEDADVGDDIIELDDEFWGHELVGGEWLGFFPHHFGKYEVTQVLGDGRYRISLPLRVALTKVRNGVGSFAKLDNIVMAMRLESEAAGTVQRALVASEGNTLTLVEVEDRDVRAYFDD